MEPNPYESSLSGQVAGVSRPRLGLGDAALWSIALASLLGCGLLIAGWLVGRVMHDADPQYWNDRAVDVPMEYGRLHTSLRFALNGGAVGFWAGLAAPWLRYAWLRHVDRSRGSPWP
jgi:hypothetical protein